MTIEERAKAEYPDETFASSMQRAAFIRGAQMRVDGDPYKRALEELVALKDHKDRIGKDAEYERRQPLAWEAARTALASIEVKEVKSKEDWISLDEYQQHVDSIVDDYPVLMALKGKRYDEYHSNVQSLVDDKLGAKKEVRYMISKTDNGTIR